jgi:N-acetylmuramic acid 6-phosphate etherase
MLPDRSHLLTEQRNPRTTNLHALSAAECVRLINEEDGTVLDAVRAAQPAVVAFLGAIEENFRAGGRLIYLGAGTSGRLGVLDASEAPPTFCIEPGRIVGLIAGGDSALRRSSEGKEDDPEGARPELESLALTPRDALLGIAAGGTTPYVRGGITLAKALCPGIATGLLTCAAVDAPPGCDHLIAALTGPEVLTGSTRMKAGTATKLILNTISTTLMVRSGRVFENLMVDLRASNDKLRDRAARIVSTVTGVPRDAALVLLDRAGGGAKAAILMGVCDISPAEAQARLAAAGGRLDVAIRGHPPGQG